VNFDIRGLTGGFNYNPLFQSSQIFDGIPFDFTLDNNGNNVLCGNEISCGSGQHVINVGLFGVTNVYTLINSLWGSTNINVGSLTFNGDAGASYTVQLIEEDNVRDHYYYIFVNTTTAPYVTQNVFGYNYGAHLDMQNFVLPSSFHNQILNNIVFNSIGESSGSTFIAGITIQTNSQLSAPTAITVTHGNGSATVSFTAPSNNGGSAITGYTVTATPVGGGDAITATGTSSPITVTGLTNGITYTFTVAATNVNGTGAASAIVYPHPEISPLLHLFPKIDPGTTSAARTFTITNKANATRNITTVTLGSTDSDEFSISANGCESQALATNASCSVAVVFNPQNLGAKVATLLVNMDDPNIATLTGVMTNYEDRASEAQRRIPAVLSTVKVYLASDTSKTAVTQLNAGQSYTVEWKLEGYGSDYRSYAAIFDCATSDNNCGASASNATSKSNLLAANSTVNGNWSYDDQQTKVFTYSYSFTAPASGRRLVLRFYQGAANDVVTVGYSPVSLLLPGNLGIGYFDNVGRRLSLLVQ